MKPTLRLAFVLWLFSSTQLAAQKAVNVKQQSQGNKIVITFDLVGASIHKKISVRPGFVVGDTPADYTIIKTIEGDTGVIQSIDGAKQIVWDIYKDIKEPPKFDVVIKVESEWRVPVVYGLSFSGNTLAPIGLKYHRMGRHGFYVSAKTLGFSFPKTAGTSTDLKTGSLKPTSPYQYESTVRQSYCLNAGYSRMIIPALHVYGGLGYGIDRSLWEIVNLDGDLNSSGEPYWVQYDEGKETFEGTWLAELGVNARFNKLLLDFGVGLFAGESVYFNFGIGYVLKSQRIAK